MLNWSLNTITRTTTQPQGNANNSHSPPIWSEKQKEYFVKSINLEKVNSLNEKILNVTQTTANINNITNYIGDIFIEAAYKVSPQTPRPFIRRKFDKPWFGQACKIARKQYHRAKHIHSISKSSQSKEILNLKCKTYKKTMNKYMNLHKKNKIQKLREMHNKNPKKLLEISK